LTKAEAKEEVLNSDFAEIGRMIIEGIVSGFGLEAGHIAEGLEALGLGDSVFATLCAIFGIHSPSKLTEYIGQMIIEGISSGMGKAAASINWGDTLKGLGSDILAALTKELEVVQDGLSNQE
jgi:hypothetical protein